MSPPYRENNVVLEAIASSLGELQDWCWEQGLDACLAYHRNSLAGYVITIIDGDDVMRIEWNHYAGDPRSLRYDRSYRLWNPTAKNLKRCVRRHFFGRGGSA